MATSEIISVRNKQLMIRNTATGELHRFSIGFGKDGSLTLIDLETDRPYLESRQRFKAWPDDQAVMDAVSELLGASHVLEEVSDRGAELDPSALAGLGKMPVDIFDDVYLEQVKANALVLCVDIRNFSDFLCSHEEEEVFKLIKSFTSNFLSCVNQFGYGCSYYKLMGDGAIVIWDETDTDTVASALLVFDSYTEFLNEDLFKDHPGLSMAGALVCDKVFKYEISAEASQLKYRDYVGYGINLACRIQALAKGNELVINHTLANTGLVPFRPDRDPDLVAELRTLKGLRMEDRDTVLYYTRTLAE
jgi:class 3 adenylate cyclase